MSQEIQDLLQAKFSQQFQQSQQSQQSQPQTVSPQRPSSSDQISLNVGLFTPIKPIPYEVPITVQQIQQEDDYYRPLTQKLESVYKQITQKKQPLSRTQYYQKRKQAKQQALIKETAAKVDKQLTHTPLLNSKSRDMLHHYAPIHRRFTQVIELKNKKIEKSRQEREEEKKAQEDQILRYIGEHKQLIKMKHQNVRSPEEYMSYMEAWEKKLQHQREAKLVQEEEEIKKMCKFVPEINQKSKQIVEKQGKRVPIEERMIEIKEMPEDQQCTFKPKINKTYQEGNKYKTLYNNYSTIHGSKKY